MAAAALHATETTTTSRWVMARRGVNKVGAGDARIKFKSLVCISLFVRFFLILFLWCVCPIAVLLTDRLVLQYMYTASTWYLKMFKRFQCMCGAAGGDGDGDSSDDGMQVMRDGRNASLRGIHLHLIACLLYTSPSPRDRQKSRMPSSA